MFSSFTDSSPDVPLATFSPENQFADVGGSARFFCEAFVGKKDLPDISIVIQWYHVLDDNLIHPISDEQQETVKREEEQIIGSYLTIPHIQLHNYGRYLCRVEIGNSQTHRLEMSAELINALPIDASRNTIFLNPYFLASCAALVTVLLFFLLFRSHKWWARCQHTSSKSDLDMLDMKVREPKSTAPQTVNKHPRRYYHDRFDISYI